MAPTMISNQALALLIGTSTVLVTGSSAHADPDERWDGGTAVRVLAGEAVGVIGGAAGGLIVGGLIGWPTGATLGEKQDNMVKGALIGMLAGAAFGISAGAQLAGDAHGGSGRWWGTAIGGAASVGLSAGLIAATWGSRGLPDDDGKRHLGLPFKAAMVASAVLLTAGPFLGYELTSDARTTSPTSFVIPLTSVAF